MNVPQLRQEIARLENFERASLANSQNINEAHEIIEIAQENHIEHENKLSHFKDELVNALALQAKLTIQSRALIGRANNLQKLKEVNAKIEKLLTDINHLTLLTSIPLEDITNLLEAELGILQSNSKSLTEEPDYNIDDLQDCINIRQQLDNYRNMKNFNSAFGDVFRKFGYPKSKSELYFKLVA